MNTILNMEIKRERIPHLEELMGEMESAVALYSKVARLLVFLLTGRPSLILNPPFTLTNSEQYKLRNHIDILNNRQCFSRSQRMTLLKCDGNHGILNEKF
ncbi:hypothetical protein Fmac_029004 [Flemingia macrophylla]|uniref:Uncharacterized protein n=1 Tax=Flemingia macrophylla TaxID=520843 RepID=A0ABD1L944_9FABA